MMSVKGGTQTWSKSSGQSFKADPNQQLSPAERQQALGGEDSIGDVLNKVADPNYIDPSKKMRTTGNPELGKDAFMSLLLTQMKNQDPTSPLKSHEMAAQLAQFTSLEKLNNINDGITGMRKDNQPDHNFQALSFIGKTIQTDNSKVTHVDKDERHDIRFTLPADAPEMKMVIKDGEGNPLRELQFKNLKAGKNVLNWNGLADDGSAAPLGEYNVSFEATGSNGRKLQVSTKTEGVISGVNFTPAGPQLLIGKQAVSLAEVKQITDGALHQRGEAPAQAVPNALPIPTAAPSATGKANEMKPETKEHAAKAALMKRGNLNDFSMAQGLINSLNKAGAKAGMEG